MSTSSTFSCPIVGFFALTNQEAQLNALATKHSCSYKRTAINSSPSKPTIEFSVHGNPEHIEAFGMALSEPVASL